MRGLEEFRYWNTFAVREWYPIISEFTFKTLFCPVSEEEARTLLSMQEDLLRRGQDAKVDLSPLAALQERLEPMVASLAPVFVKLSDRSGKDAAFCRGRVEREMRTMVGGPKTLATVYRAMMCSLKTNTAAETLLLLVDSFRILEDVRHRMSFLPDFEWKLDICVREYRKIDPLVEYRAFAVDGKLTAVSQYIHDCFCEEIFDNQAAHAAAIQVLWNEMMAKTTLASKYVSMVVDFVILDSGKAWVVELNPFDASTDSCLFGWVAQKSLLHKGPAEGHFPGTTFAWRVVESKATATKTQERWWRKLLEETTD